MDCVQTTRPKVNMPSTNPHDKTKHIHGFQISNLPGLADKNVFGLQVLCQVMDVTRCS